jgi:hypothetical protein
MQLLLTDYHQLLVQVGGPAWQPALPALHCASVGVERPRQRLHTGSRRMQAGGSTELSALSTGKMAAVHDHVLRCGLSWCSTQTRSFAAAIQAAACQKAEPAELNRGMAAVRTSAAASAWRRSSLLLVTL